jgi:hypothetical protein
LTPAPEGAGHAARSRRASGNTARPAPLQDSCAHSVIGGRHAVDKFRVIPRQGGASPIFQFSVVVDQEDSLSAHVQELQSRSLHGDPCRAPTEMRSQVGAADLKRTPLRAAAHTLAGGMAPPPWRRWTGRLGRCPGGACRAACQASHLVGSICQAFALRI